MEKKYLITYDNSQVIAISEAPDGGVLLTKQSFIIETIENAKTMLSALGVDITSIENYNLN